MVQSIDQLNREGYTVEEARLIQLVQEYAEENEKFGKRFGNGQYSLADVVRILAPRVTTWRPLPSDEAQSIIGEGLHTGLRKGSGAPEAPALWNAVNDSDEAWSDALAYLVWGLDYMGLALCKKGD